MARQIGGAQGQHHDRLGAVDHRDQHGGRPRRHDAGPLPRTGSRSRSPRTRRRRRGRQSAAGTSRVSRRRARSKKSRPGPAADPPAQASSGRCILELSAGAIAKNSPPDATPNIAVPSTSRSSPSSTRSKNSARVTLRPQIAAHMQIGLQAAGLRLRLEAQRDAPARSRPSRRHWCGTAARGPPRRRLIRSSTARNGASSTVMPHFSTGVTRKYRSPSRLRTEANSLTSAGRPIGVFW